MPMLRFGAGSTMAGFATYFAGNIDKLLLGRVWGSEALGLYVRAFTLISFPTDSLNATIGEVAFAALSRTRGDSERLRRFFLKSYSLVVMFTLPLATVCGLFAKDIVEVVLGSKWSASAEIFRVLSPTIIALAILNPLGWLLTALGLVTRGLHIASATAPLVAVVVLVALPFGPLGVATAYSAAMVIRVIPVTAWALRGTGVRLGEIAAGLSRPFAACAAAAVFALAMRSVYGSVQISQLRLLVELSLFFGLYAPTIFLIAGRGGMFHDLLRTAKATSPQ
jgi:PST family polysaccharide transporter